MTLIAIGYSLQLSDHLFTVQGKKILLYLARNIVYHPHERQRTYFLSQTNTWLLSLEIVIYTLFIPTP